MSILTAIGVSLISLAIAGYLVSLLRPAHHPGRLQACVTQIHQHYSLDLPRTH